MQSSATSLQAFKDLEGDALIAAAKVSNAASEEKLEVADPNCDSDASLSRSDPEVQDLEDCDVAGSFSRSDPVVEESGDGNDNKSQRDTGKVSPSTSDPEVEVSGDDRNKSSPSLFNPV